ncbi:MAG TPA: YbaN family protein [Stenotrophomonas sp.]|jgi:uncharacterized membrane protein YbaN (DUF454 family)
MTIPSRDSLPSAPAAQRPVRWRWAWWLLAYVSLGVGIVGIFVPGLPTTVFVLISAWAAARGSERLHQRLLSDPRFGPAIVQWQTHRAVSRKAKWMATATMLVCAAIMGWCVPSRLALVFSIGSMVAVGAWLWCRPETRADP